jgi:hypothetical protein
MDYRKAIKSGLTEENTARDGEEPEVGPNGWRCCEGIHPEERHQRSEVP